MNARFREHSSPPAPVSCQRYYTGSVFSRGTADASMTQTYVPTVLLHKTSLLQRLADFVRLGYVHWTTGTVPLKRAARLCTKFSDFYATHLSSDQRYRRKRQGRGNAHLLLWQEYEGSEITWFLLVTAGEHPAHVHEQLLDARTDRITVTGYELVRQTRVGQATPAWTWRMTEAHYQAWRGTVVEMVRRHVDLALSQDWRSLHRSPGFAPIRRQVRKIAALCRAEWKRTRSGPFPAPQIRVPYVSRLRHESVPLRVLLSAQAVGTAAQEAKAESEQNTSSSPRQPPSVA